MPEPTLVNSLKAWLHRGRVLWLTLLVFGVMSALAPREFANSANLGNIIRAASTDALAAVGFTAVMLCGQLDLSVGQTMTLGGVTMLFTQPLFGWWGAVAAAAVVGLLIGLFNGLLVTRAKINSFIVTLGTLTILQGISRMLLQGGSKSLDNVAEGMRIVNLLQDVLPWSPRVLLIFIPVLLAEAFLRWTPPGRNLFLIGGNRQAAFFAGVRPERYVLLAFVACGVLSSLGGAFTAASQNTAMPNLGEKSLMLIVAATIIGGTAMAGGRGSVLMSVIALIALNALTNGLSYLGASKSVKLIANGALLALSISYDAWRTLLQDAVRGQRQTLLAEWREGRAENQANSEENTDLERTEMMNTPSNDRTFAIVSVACVACVAIVAIFAMHLRTQPSLPPPHAPQAAQQSLQPAATAAAPAAPAAAPVDPQSLRSTDNQKLIGVDPAPLNAPERPADPSKLADDDPLRWYDYEYAGWKIQKLPMPKSPGTGPKEKKVVSLQYMDHPYWQSYGNGMKRMAAAYGMDLTIMEAGNDNKVQSDQVEQVIRMKPDLVILTPVDSNGVVPMLKRLYDEKIPTIASNLLPVDEGMKYCITWTGPDDWGQFRMLAREFAKKLNNEGNYAVIRHVAGTSCYLSRTWSAVSELKKIAPKMKCLDMQSTDLKTEETKTQVAAWLKKYGKDLKGIISADDSKAQVGIAEALKDAGREDVVCVAAGSSRTGLEFIKAGKLHAITFQSAEGDGALPIHIAAEWFSGKPVDRPVYYLEKHIITAADVDKFLPAQW